MTQISGSVAIITGAAQGIGRATAQSLAARGARLVLLDIDPLVEETAADLVAKGAEVLALQIDIGRGDAFDEVRERTLARFGTVDILMNNAGVLTSALFEDTPMEEWDRVLNLNVLSVVRAIKAFMPDLIAKGCGHVVNVASFAGLYPYAVDRITYAASKGAVVTMTESLALYLEPKGVGVTLLCPGPVNTGIGSRRAIFTEGLALRGPGKQFGVKDPAEVGEMVATAIETNRFFLPTDEQVNDLLRERAADVSAFVRKQTSALVDD